MSETPTVVLVHGAFADASSFAHIVPELLRETRVVAAAGPNRSLAGDAAYVASANTRRTATISSASTPVPPLM